MADLMADISLIEPVHARSFQVTGVDLDQLTISMLSEVLFFMAAKNFFPCQAQVTPINIKEDKKQLQVEIQGDFLSDKIEKHREIKAVTFHQFKIWQQEDEFFLQVYFDV